MKRFLSIILCVMMLVSVFSIGASAMVPTSYEVVTPAVPQKDYVKQDFSDAEDVDFTVDNYGTASVPQVSIIDETVDNKVLEVTAAGKSVVYSDVVAADVLDAGDKVLTVEFKVYPVTTAESIIVGVRMPHLLNLVYAKDTSKENCEHMYIIGHQNFNAGAWNTVKVEVNIPDGYTVTNATYPDNGQSASAIVTVNGTPLTRKDGGSGSNDSRVAEAGKYGVMTHSWGSSAIKTDGKLAYIGIGGTASDTAPAEGRKVRYDDIKVYVPGTPEVTEAVNYPINDGVLLTVAEEKTYAASEMGFDNSVKKLETVSYTGSNMTANNCILTFDAKVNIDNGYPLTIQVSNGRKVGAVNIVANETSSSDWYTYKIHISDTQDGATSSYMDKRILNVRKAADTQNDLADLTWKWDILTSRTGSGAGTGYVEFGYLHSLNADVYDAALIDDTVWSVRNFQLIDADNNGAVTAKATANGDGTATVVANFSTAANAATPIVAVYDSVTNKLVDVAYAAAAYKNDGKFEATVDYAATGNTAKLYIWDGIGTAMPILTNALTLNVQ